LLKPEATRGEIVTLCKEAAQYHFASVCVNPYWVPICAKELTGTGVKVCTVIGFPLGANSPKLKAFEAAAAKSDGANEFDMVVNIGALKSDDFKTVFHDISSVVEAVKGDTVKVILETALLTDEEKIEACALSKEAGANFVKTSTGFAKGGATVVDVELMKKVVGEQLEVKASGGVRDYQTAVSMIKAGATRIGASAGISILKGETGKTNY
jgi:deoxyribose-phosphate aldolase